MPAPGPIEVFAPVVRLDGVLHRVELVPVRVERGKLVAVGQPRKQVTCDSVGDAEALADAVASFARQVECDDDPLKLIGAFREAVKP